MSSLGNLFYGIVQKHFIQLQNQLKLHNPAVANSEKLCETESVSTGVLQQGQRYIYEFPWKTSLSSMGENYMHLTNTFKDELTFYLKQYTLCNAIDSSISLLHLHRMYKRGILCKSQMFCFLNISCGCTP